MNLSAHDEQRMRLLCDDSPDTDSIYRRACTFVAEIETVPSTTQLAGLLALKDSFNDLCRFASYQEERFRDDQHRGYGPFYQGVRQQLDGIKKLAATEFVPDGLTKKQQKERAEYYSTLLAREFVTHLVAEARLKHPVRENTD